MSDKINLEVSRVEYDMIMCALAIYAAQATVRATKSTDERAKAGALANGRYAGDLYDKLSALHSIDASALH